MHLQLRTKVPGDHKQVFAAFTKDLLEELVPPGMKIDILRYDEPTRVGGIVHLKMKVLGLISQEWYMEITEYEEGAERSFFVDRGVRLPGFLKSWQHKHLIEQEGDHSVIVDDVNYTGRFGFLSVLLYPVIWLQFAARRPMYRKKFGKV